MTLGVGVNIQRTSNRLSQAVKDSIAGGAYPDLLLDVDDAYFRANGGSKAFSDVVTHSRSGNATMVDGYGPELVTNGTFDSDLSDWTVEGGTASVNNGRLFVTAGPGGFVYVSQSFATKVGVRYILTLNLDTVTSTHNYVALGTSSNNLAYSYINVGTGKQSYEVTFTATETTSVIKFSTGIGSGLSSFWDNVSVREMPVLKWAPHNLCLQSEAWDTSPWVSTVGDTVTENAGTAPDGSNTASLFETDGTAGNLQQNINLDPATYTVAFWVKNVDATAGLVNIYNLTTSTSIASVDYVSGLTTGVWTLVEQSFTLTASGNIRIQFARDFSANSSAYFWGAHVYRSDLGGMVDNPDRGDSYVPTTSSAAYLPRRGHHVYNGSAWVNEGLLHESEARSNLIWYSDFFNNSAWFKGGASVTADTAISPDGTENAEKLVSDTSTSFHYAGQGAGGSSGTYTASCYIKAAGYNYGGIRLVNDSFGSDRFSVLIDLTDGSFVDSETIGSPSVSNFTIEDAGNGWYRLSVSLNHSAGALDLSVFMNDDASPTWASGIGMTTFTGDGSSGIYVYGAQLEAGPTPSSYIPTAGATVTRAAETLTIPSANLPWPTPQVIGDELVTNGTFDTDLDGWTAGSDWSWESGKARDSGTNPNPAAALSQSISTTSGKVYAVSFDVSGLSGGSPAFSWGGVTIFNFSTSGHYEKYLVATGSSTTIQFSGQLALYYLDNVSVREINPLSVSIQMDGRMTYADDGVTGGSVYFINWTADSNNYISTRLYTDSTKVGDVGFLQKVGGVTDVVASGDIHSPGILVPFNIASRHGSTFINGATDGVALTADTTPTALPDLSSTDLELGPDYMGTIKTFRIWDKDLGDTGIEAATAPSLEPSLELVFDGSQSSFVVLDWEQ